MRIKMHPDRLKKPGMSEEELKQIDEEAGRVGQAAELLTNPTMVSVPAEFVDRFLRKADDLGQRREHDRELRGRRG